MTTLVWLFLGMSVLITSFITWKITSWNNKRRTNNLFKKMLKTIKHSDKNIQNWFETQLSSFKIKNKIK